MFTLKICGLGRISHESDDVITAFRETGDDDTADEPRPAGYDDAHGRAFSSGATYQIAVVESTASSQRFTSATKRPAWAPSVAR